MSMAPVEPARLGTSWKALIKGRPTDPLAIASTSEAGSVRQPRLVKRRSP